MRHQRKVKRLSLVKGHRRALERNLVRSLVEHQRIITTLARAKLARGLAEHLLALGKRKSLHAYRQVAQELGSRDLARRLVHTLAPHFATRNGGCTRILRLGKRRGDQAERAILEFVETVKIEKAPGKEKKKTKLKPAPEKARSPAVGQKGKAKESEGELAPLRKEAPKKGGFLSALRRFLKGDES